VAIDEWNRMRELMRQYHDCPMDLADASLVAAAERLHTKQIFTFDSHFRVYRINTSDWFDVIP
jgi:predicted nucleic acid-binding protein